MEEKLEPYKIISSTFLGRNESGTYTYELTFNQSLEHIGRWKGIEDGLDKYREDEIKKHEEDTLKEAEEIRKRRSEK